MEENTGEDWYLWRRLHTEENTHEGEVFKYKGTRGGDYTQKRL